MEEDDEHPAAFGPAYVLYVGTFPETVFLPTATVISSLEPTSRNFSFLDSVDEENRDVCSKKVGSLWQVYNFRAPTKTEVPSPEENRVMQTGGTPSAVPKTLPKSANAPTQPTVLAADKSSTGNNLQENCADSPDTAPKLRLRKSLAVSKMPNKVEP